jgi:hypothetical protein
MIRRSSRHPHPRVRGGRTLTSPLEGEGHESEALPLDGGGLGGGDAGRRYRTILQVLLSCVVLVWTASISHAERPRQFEIGLSRLTGEQYRQIIGDVFGPTVVVDGIFEPDPRKDGLLAVGSSSVSVTETGLEQYDALALKVATQVVDREHRDTLLPCKPASATTADDACAGQFFEKVGRLLYRRPLTPDELTERVSVAREASGIVKDFYAGLALSLAGMLEAPEFLFRQEMAEADPDHPGQYRLTGLSKASRLSFFLWDTAPDAMLLAAAEAGELDTAKGLGRQADRMLASPRLEDGARAFFADMLQFDQFAELSKDAMIYPRFSPIAARDAEEQTLRTIVDHLLTRRGDYRDLFTTRKTFLTPSLAAVYGVPLADDTPNGAGESWIPFEYAPADPRGAGILAEASFVALHSHPGRSSPTLRGRALREVLLCEKVPDPPANVDFTLVQDVNNPQYKTTRERLTAHRAAPTCAGCHRLIDPMGLALENFDSSGGFRTRENGVPIDASGELDGVKFSDAPGLGKAMHDNPAATSCLVTRLYAYATGRSRTKADADFEKQLAKGFADSGYQLPALMRAIATGDEFYRVAATQIGALSNTGKEP